MPTQCPRCGQWQSRASLPGHHAACRRPEESLRRAPMRSEREILATTLEALRNCPGVYVYRQNAGMASAEHRGRRRVIRFGGVTGMPDIAGFAWRDRGTGREAVPLYVEVKRPGQRPTAEQAAFLANAERHGCLARVVTAAADAVAMVREWQGRR